MDPRNVIKAMPAYLAGIASKAGIKLVIGGTRACTDGQTVYLPSMPVPTGTEDAKEQARYLEDVRALAVGFILHESCHINHTSFSASDQFKADTGIEVTPALHGFVNAMEDIRIEHLASQKWLGLRSMISDKLAVMARDGWKDPAEMPEAMLLQMHLHFWLRAQILGNSHVEEAVEAFTREAESRFGAAFCRVIEGISLEITDCKSTVEVIHLTHRIQSAIEEAIQRKQEELSQSQGNDVQDQQESASADQDTGSGEASGSDPDDPVGSGQEDGNPGEDGGEDPADDSNEAQSNAGGGGSGEAPEGAPDPCSPDDSTSADGEGVQSPDQGDEVDEGCSDTDATQDQVDNMTKVLEAKEDEILQHQDEEVAKRLEDLAGEESAQQHGCSTAGGYQSLRVESRPRQTDGNRLAAMSSNLSVLANRLVRFLNGQATTDKSLHDKGRSISGRHLANLATSGRIFRKKRRQTLPNTLVEILVDRSGSMEGSINLALDAAACVGAALESIDGVKVGITAFPDIVQVVVPGEGVRRQIGRMHLTADGGTPMGEAMWWLGGRMMAAREDRKILLVITDGAPCSTSQTSDAVRALTGQGIECLAIGIQTSIGDCQRMFERCANINSIDELAQAMVDILSPSLGGLPNAA